MQAALAARSRRLAIEVYTSKSVTPRLCLADRRPRCQASARHIGESLDGDAMLDTWMRYAAAIAVLIAAPALTFAQAPDPSGVAAENEPPEYRDLVRQGTQEFELGNYAEARSLFERAHELYPNARTSRALGMAEFELRNYRLAAQHLEQALASNVKPLAADTRPRAEELLRRARGFLGRIRIQVEPANAVVLLDGQPLEAVENDESVLVVGDHVLEFRATGFASERRSIRIVDNEVQSVSVKLAALEEASANTSFADGEREPNRTPVYKKWWLWTTVGVVVAAGVGTAVWLALREPKTRFEYQEAPGTLTDHGLQVPEK